MQFLLSSVELEELEEKMVCAHRQRQKKVDGMGSVLQGIIYCHIPAIMVKYCRLNER